MNDEAELYQRRYERERTARKSAEQIAEDKSRELYLKGQELSEAVASAQTAKQETEMLLNGLKLLSTALHVQEAVLILRTLLNEIAPSKRIGIYMKTSDLFESVGGDAPEGKKDELLYDQDRLQMLKILNYPYIIEDTRDNRLPALLGISPGILSMLLLTMRMREQTVAFVFLESEQPGAYSPTKARLAQALVDESVITMENARLFQEIERLSTTDPLTGLNNRRHFEAAGEREISLANRHRLPLTMIMLDIDNFKLINDKYGHSTGDKVLVEIADICRTHLRATDINLRFGGEELGFLCPNTGIQGALVLAERIRSSIAEHVFAADGPRITATVSLGIAELVYGEDTLGDLIKKADRALYQAKNKGRNRTEIH